MYEGFARLASDIVGFLPRLPEVAFSFLIGYLVLSIILTLFSHALSASHVHKALITILRSLLSVVLWVILTAHILRGLGLSQIAVTISGSLLVIGLAIANGAQSTVADIISGLFLAKDPDFDIGYLVKSGETEGIIESIDIRKTRIRTRDGILHVVPNSLIDKERWQVLSRTERTTALARIRGKLQARKKG